MRTPTDKEYVHDRLGEQFADALSLYDTNRRVETLVDLFLGDVQLQGIKVLEVGAGLGFFTARLIERGADVTPADIGESLVRQLRSRFGRGVVADALNLTAQFERDSFDVVLSSECIEHTPEPRRALREMAAVLRPGGYLSLSTPNRVWWPAVKGATALGLRPFDGHENFSSFRGIRTVLEAANVRVVREYGLHLFPFQVPFHKVSRWCDEHLQFLRGCMIDICVLGKKLPA